MTFIAPYALPVAIARAHACRHYTALQLEAHAEALQRMARMSAAPAALQPAPAPLPAPPAAPGPPAIPNAQVAAYMGPLTLAQIIKHEVAAEFEMTVAKLLCERRVASIVLPRMTAMWLHHKLIVCSLPAIGRSFKRPDGIALDHTTALNAVRVVARKMERDPAYADRVARIRENIRITQAMIAAGKADAPVAEVPAPVKKTPSTMRYVSKPRVWSMDPSDVRKRAYRAAKKAIRVEVSA